MTDSEKALDVKDTGNRIKRRDAVLRQSVLFAYVNNRSAYSISDRTCAFEAAAAAFRQEMLSALEIKPYSENPESTDRRELLRPFIVKLLLYLGKIPTEFSFMVAARLIEGCVLYPNANIKDLIEQLAGSVGSTFATIKRLAEGSIEWYDCNVAERITYLTGTKPFNALDALCDLAIYVRLKMSDVKQHA